MCSSDLVPFVVYDPTGTWNLAPVDNAGIASIGATLLTLLDTPIPACYLPSLVRR